MVEASIDSSDEDIFQNYAGKNGIKPIILWFCEFKVGYTCKMNDSNSTVDVASKGCFIHYDQTACIKNISLVTMMSITFVLCSVRIARLHIVKHPQVQQYIIFYLSCIECILCIVNWMIGGSLPQLDISASYFKLLQFILMSHFYWTLAARILHKEHLVYRVIMPILGVYVVYFTSVAIYGIVFATSSWTECLAPEWLMMSAAEFLVVQLFMVAGRYITVKINSITTPESFKRSQKRDLWCLIIAFEVSALAGVAYDSTMKILGNDETGCSGIFVIKYMVPIWTMLAVFKIYPGHLNEDEERFLQWSTEDVPSTSVFNTRQAANPYKQMFNPSSRNNTSPNNSPPMPNTSSNTITSRPMKKDNKRERKEGETGVEQSDPHV
ncbi:hypothetical protein GQR58_014757 [Nymphon striatum]|nr:hypothetical protein GQR58_014757 [Nymphon striatum]